MNNTHDLEHKCTSINCNESFSSELRFYGRRKVSLSAHSKVFLHARKKHNVVISFGCHVNCDYIKRE